MNGIGKNLKWYEKIIMFLWYMPIQLLKEKNQENKEKNRN